MNKDNQESIEQAMREVSKFYLILSEGERGHHLLFTPEMIRMTFEKDVSELSKLFNDNLDEINRVLNQSMVAPGLDAKKDLIAAQSEDLQRALVYGYFQLLEGQSAGNSTLH
jgi:ketosteroid isomerase-like protein